MGHTPTGTGMVDAARRAAMRPGCLGNAQLSRGRARALLGAATLAMAAACSDSAVPFFDAPTSVPTSTTGIQNAITGLFSATRSDVPAYVSYAGSFGRDIFEFQGASPGTFGPVAGLNPPTNTGPQATGVWDNEYLQIRQANTIIASLTSVSAYTPQQAAAIVGVVQTIKALNFMMLAETRDTLGIPLYAVVRNPLDPPYCNKDVWAYIVALLDSGFARLNAAGTTSLPVLLPVGFASVAQTAAPSTATGAFAAFNRALAGKAGLEYAYALARSTAGTHPTPSSMGSPNQVALLRADSALTASALYDPSAIVPPAAGS